MLAPEMISAARDLLPHDARLAILLVDLETRSVAAEGDVDLLGNTEGTQTCESVIVGIADSTRHGRHSGRSILLDGGVRVCVVPAGRRPAHSASHFLAVVVAGAVPEPAVSALAALCSPWPELPAGGGEGEDVRDRLLREQKAIIDHITDGLIVLDQDGVVRFMNPPAGRILNLVPDRSLGKKLGDLLDYELNVAPIFRTGVGYVDREVIRDLPNRHVHLLDTAIPIKDAAGKVLSVVNTFREIHSVRRMTHSMLGNQARYTFGDIVGHSPALREATDIARRAAEGSANVLLTGESGTGKEVFAQAIHAHSGRADGPFMAINCAALPRDLIESELFGFEHGSFTGARRGGRPGKFELTSGGTIFLDEVGEMPLDVQAKLLRVLQEKEVVRIGDDRPIPVDVRIIAATNRSLEELLDSGRFREDLYFRLNVIHIHVPPLRERSEDIPILANHFLRKYSATLNRPIFRIGTAAMDTLKRFEWPGNVRELENVIERTVHLCDDAEIVSIELPRRPPGFARGDRAAARIERPAAEPATLAERERNAILEVMRHTRFNLAQTARLLGVSRSALYAKMRRHAISVERQPARAPGTADDTRR